MWFFVNETSSPRFQHPLFRKSSPRLQHPLFHRRAAGRGGLHVSHIPTAVGPAQSACYLVLLPGSTYISTNEEALERREARV